ncbi:unnamed protein product [Urochloa decumbens]|uniref:X8 domain-containing protein n=1 Tax=Urochloa decumbens TaxID=240449 RepID=A0ABC9E3V7_9POAL
MIKNYSIFILALFIFMQHDWADGASMTGEEYSFPNLVYSPSLPPYKDVIGGSDTSTTPAADASPPPPYCLYPPPAKPAMPAPLLPVASPPGASPTPPTTGPPSIAPGITTPGGAAPPPFMPPPAFPAVPPPGGQEERRGTWCVANPKAASAVVQTAMDYACGSGADCGSVAAPGGACYLPDTLAAHASYAFNSYWQRTKAAGGTCDFAGAAMLVTTDPSHDGCKFVCM